MRQTVQIQRASLNNQVMDLLVVGGKPFAWHIAPDIAKEAQNMIGHDPSMRAPIQAHIYQNFMKCLGEFLRKTVTIQQLNEAVDQGFIEL